MKCQRIIWGLAFLTAAASQAVSVAAAPNTHPRAIGLAQSSRLRDWTVKDSAKVRYFLTRQNEDTWTSINGDEAVVFSPDKSYFFFVYYFGDLSCDCRIYRLELFSAAEVNKAFDAEKSSGISATPIRVVEFRSLSQRDSDHPIFETQAILNAAWSSDGQFITFLGIDPETKKMQAFKLDAAGGVLHRLTSLPDGANWLTVVGDGAIIRSGRLISVQTSQNYPIHVATRKDLLRDTFPSYYTSELRLETYVRYGEAPAWKMESGYVPSGGPWFAPTGRYAVMVRTPTATPKAAVVSSANASRGLAPGSGEAEFRQFFLIDLIGRNARPFFDAPTGDLTVIGGLKRDGSTNESLMALSVAPQALWSRDGRHVVLVNTSLPDQGNAAHYSDDPYVIDYDVVASKYRILAPLRDHDGFSIESIEWIREGETFRIMSRRAGQARVVTYAYSPDGWAASSLAQPVIKTSNNVTQTESAFRVKLEQGANMPPTVFAEKGNARLNLSGEDPALKGVWWARSREVVWKDSEGITRFAGLLLPRHKRTGKKIPLVIQAGYYIPDQYLPDGSAPTGYAAQAMVARGMAVLNLSSPKEKVLTPQETAQFLDSIATVLPSLASTYNIDVKNLGLVGFSRNGFRVLSAITDPHSVSVKAAVVADGITGSPLEYFEASAVATTSPNQYEKLYGGNFYSNRDAWIKNIPLYNLQRVSAPALFVFRKADLYALEVIGAFNQARRPYDYLVMPYASHQLNFPIQREASLQATVDWMAFWLLGEKPLDSLRAERWSATKDMWARQRAWEAAGHTVGSVPDADIYPPANVSNQ